MVGEVHYQYLYIGEIEIETATESGELGGDGRMGDWTRGEAFR